MERFLLSVILTFSAIMMTAQDKIYMTAGDKTVPVTLADTEAARRLAALLSVGPMAIEMEDYGGFEKVGQLPQALPTSNSQIRTEAGDIMLYQGRSIVVFYGSNSWSYTRLGKIDGATVASVREFLGSGSVVITLSLTDTAGVADVDAEATDDGAVYDTSGRKVNGRPLAPGVYIKGGKKFVVRN